MYRVYKVIDSIREFLHIKSSYYCETHDRRFIFSSTTDPNAAYRCNFICDGDYRLYRRFEFMGWHCFKHVHTVSHAKLLKPIRWSTVVGGEE